MFLLIWVARLGLSPPENYHLLAYVATLNMAACFYFDSYYIILNDRI